MAKRRASRKIGLSPGTLVYVGEHKTDTVKLTVFDYAAGHCEEKEVHSPAQCRSLMAQPSVTWLNVSGVHDLAVIEALGREFNLHPLLLEDVVNTEQRPKQEDYDDYLYVVLKMLYIGPDHRIRHEQISLVVGKGCVISLQEFEGDVFDPVRERIKKGRGHLRERGADYLAYALIDTIVDNYFKVLEEIGEAVEALQDDVLSNPRPATLHQIQHLKHEMIMLRKSVWPLREIIGGLVRGDSEMIQGETLLFFRDVYDHTIQVIDTIEALRDMLSGMLDIYLSSVSNRMNEVMKVLTVIATIFIPMTFAAGIYGMNFKYMPELEWRWAYPVFWLVLIAVFIAMMVWFKRRRWL